MTYLVRRYNGNGVDTILYGVGHRGLVMNAWLGRHSDPRVAIPFYHGRSARQDHANWVAEGTCEEAFVGWL